MQRIYLKYKSLYKSQNGLKAYLIYVTDRITKKADNRYKIYCVERRM